MKPYFSTIEKSYIRCLLYSCLGRHVHSNIHNYNFSRLFIITFINKSRINGVTHSLT